MRAPPMLGAESSVGAGAAEKVRSGPRGARGRAAEAVRGRLPMRRAENSLRVVEPRVEPLAVRMPPYAISVELGGRRSCIVSVRARSCGAVARSWAWVCQAWV